MKQIEAKDLPTRIHFSADGESFTAEVRKDYRIVFWNHTLDVGGKISVPYWPGHKSPIKSFFIEHYEKCRYQFDTDAKRLRGSELKPQIHDVAPLDIEL